MTENDFREKMINFGWNNKEIDEYVRMYHWALNHGIATVSLEDYLGPKAIITRYPSFIPITEFKDET